MNRLVSPLLLAGFLLAASLPTSARAERLAIYMTVGGPLEIVRNGSNTSVLLNGRSIHEAPGASLTAQSSMSVGDPADGYDALLLRHGLGDAQCPITYDLVTVGADKTYAVVPGINKCSRIIKVNVDGDRLQFVTEKPNGRTEIVEYDDKQRHPGAPKP